MQRKRYVLCGETTTQVSEDFSDNVMRFHLYGEPEDDKLTFDIAGIQKAIFKSVPPRFRDLLDIAAYVFSADVCNMIWGEVL